MKTKSWFLATLPLLLFSEFSVATEVLVKSKDIVWVNSKGACDDIYDHIFISCVEKLSSINKPILEGVIQIAKGSSLTLKVGDTLSKYNCGENTGRNQTVSSKVSSLTWIPVGIVTTVPAKDICKWERGMPFVCSKSVDSSVALNYPNATTIIFEGNTSVVVFQPKEKDSFRCETNTQIAETKGKGKGKRPYGE